MDTLEKLELKINQILSKSKELEDLNRKLSKKSDELESELKTCRLKMEQLREENEELQSRLKEGEVKVKDKISELLGKLDEVEAEIV